VHDVSWEEAKATWADFHQSNYMFFANICSIIDSYSANRMTASIRKHIAFGFFDAVDTVGARVFRREKGEIC